MNLIDQPLKRTRDTAANRGAPSPVAASYRIESKSESSGAKGNFLATILIAGVVLVGVIILGSRIAKRVQNVKDGFASDTDAIAVETKPTRSPIKPVVEPAPTPEASRQN